MTTQNPAQDVSDAAIGAAFRLTDSINRDADKFVDDVLTRAKGIDANNTKTTKRPTVESLWQAFWATPHDERKWNRPTGTDGKPMPMTLVSFKYEVVRAAFELDAARELQQAQVVGESGLDDLCQRLSEHGAKSGRRAATKRYNDGVPTHTEMLMGQAVDAIRRLATPQSSAPVVGDDKLSAGDLRCM